MSEPRPTFEGVIGRTYADSEGWWPPLPTAPDGAPNVIVVLLDDVGYAQFGCYGSDIATPCFDRLAGEGHRYANYHTTALCSPTRACLLTGRNHHSNGMARVAELAAGFPGYNATIPKENGFLSEILLRNGYATFALGKWHVTPAAEQTMGSPRDKWPLGRGFERFYGFLGGGIDQFNPAELVYDSHPVEPPCTPEDGYHITEDLVDKSILFMRDLRASAPEKPFFLWFAPGACHAPHQAPASYIEEYRGRFDHGWDVWREEVFARQLASGLLPAGTKLSDRPSWVPAWDSLTGDEQRLYSRMMEVYAGFLTHTDAQVQRLLDAVEELGDLDDTIVIVMSDNGASAEGGATGSFNEQHFYNFVPESLEENLERIDDLGSPRSSNHYPWGWAWAGNTPLKRFKRDTHEGGVADPMIVHWPKRLGPGGTRHQYVHAIDLMPTLLDVIGIAPPDSINGIEQTPIEGVSFAPSLFDSNAPAAHVTQYYEMLGSRALYHDGWKAVVFHPTPFFSYDDTVDATRSFDEDVWELYHVAEDFSEVTNLAEQEPEQLERMKALWWEEAAKYQVLPLNNELIRFNDTRYDRQRYELYGGIGPITEVVAPNLRNRSFVMTAALTVPAEGSIDGAIVAHGTHSGGYILYLKDRRLHYTYNFVGSEITTISADAELPEGPVEVRAEFVSAATGGGAMTLFYGDVPVGSGTVPRTIMLTFGIASFAVGYQSGDPIDPALPGRARLPEPVLGRVVIETEGGGAALAAFSERHELATQ